MPKLLTIAFALLTLTACATAPKIDLMPGANAVKLYKSDPPYELPVIDEIVVSHGESCGNMGYKGTYEGVRKMLRNRVIELGGTVARIDTETPPQRGNGQNCPSNLYTVRATIYGDGTDLGAEASWPSPGPNGEVTCDGTRSSDRLEWDTPGACDSYAEMTVSDPEFAAGMAERRRAKMAK